MAPGDLISAQLAAEQRWAWSAFLAGVNPNVAALASREALGYELSPQAFRGLVEGYRAANGIARINRDARIEQQLFVLDEQQRTLRGIIASRERGDTMALDLDGRKELRAVLDQIAKLEGLYAATKVEADITTHDGTLDQLNAALVALGEAPVEVQT